MGRGSAEKETRDGLSFVTRVHLDVRVEVDDADAETLAHCLKIVKSCMITRSLMEGVAVDIHAERG